MPAIIQNDKLTDYTDVMTYKQNRIMIINEHQGLLINKHPKIFSAFRKNNLTVKDVHQLFYNVARDKYEKSERTVYRYIKEFEESGIIKAGGNRITEGSRVVKKIYCLSAHHFYYSDPSVDWWDTPEAVALSENVTKFLQEIYPTKLKDQNKVEHTIYELLTTTGKQDYDISDELIKLIPKNQRIKDLLSVDSPDDHRLFVFVTKLLLYLRNYELYEKFRLLFETD